MLPKLIQTDFKPISVSDNLNELVEKIQQSDADVFPVLDKKNRLLGLILLDEIRPTVFLSVQSQIHFYQ
jgi:chloride channel protein, CIC family